MAGGEAFWDPPAGLASLSDLPGADAATDGQVPTADGAGGVAWETPASGGSGDAAWTVVGSVGAPAFTNSWVNGNNGLDAPPRFRKLSSGLVVLDGYATGGADGTSAFTLPAGYRPPYRCLLPIASGTPGFTVIQIGADGTVKPGVGGSTGSLIGCSFYAG